MRQEDYVNDAIELLRQLIATPSVSRDEKAAADIMQRRMTAYGLAPRRDGNNVWALSPFWDDSKPTLLLNAHIDTVKPVSSWTRDPFEPTLEGDRLYGLGSNDCGGGLTTLLQVFRWLSLRPQPYNYVYLASAEEEVSGKEGFSRALPLLPKIDVAIVGEPTGMQPAIAEKGLMVLDVIAHGKSGHNEDDSHRCQRRHATQRHPRLLQDARRRAHQRALHQRGGLRHNKSQRKERGSRPLLQAPFLAHPY